LTILRFAKRAGPKHDARGASQCMVRLRALGISTKARADGPAFSSAVLISEVLLSGEGQNCCPVRTRASPVPAQRRRHGSPLSSGSKLLLPNSARSRDQLTAPLPPLGRWRGATRSTAVLDSIALAALGRIHSWSHPWQQPRARQSEKTANRGGSLYAFVDTNGRH
jgi:hypothetical protein